MWLLKKEAGFPNAESFTPGSTPEGEVGQPGASLPAHPQEEKHQQNKASSLGVRAVLRASCGLPCLHCEPLNLSYEIKAQGSEKEWKPSNQAALLTRHCSKRLKLPFIHQTSESRPAPEDACIGGGVGQREPYL